MKNIQDFWAAWILYQTRLGQHSSHRNPAVSLLRFQMLLEEDGILHSGNYGPFQTFLMCCSKRRNTFLKKIHLICLIFNLLWLKYGFMTSANHSNLFLFTFVYTASLLLLSGFVHLTVSGRYSQSQCWWLTVKKELVFSFVLFLSCLSHWFLAIPRLFASIWWGVSLSGRFSPSLTSSSLSFNL